MKQSEMTALQAFMGWQQLPPIDWETVVAVYNKCLARDWQLRNAYANIRDTNEGYFLAMTSLKNAFTPSLNNRLERTRVWMMVMDYVIWYVKNFTVIAD